MQPLKEHTPLFRCFGVVCEKAYRSWHLAANPVLAKIGVAELFHKYADGWEPPHLSVLSLVVKIFVYYLNELRYLALLVCVKIIYQVAGEKTNIPERRTVFIDTYFLIPGFLNGDDELDHYFPGMREILHGAKWECIILPRFYGSFNPLSFYKVFRSLQAANKKDILTEFQLLRLSDYVRLFWHVVVYPLELLSCYTNIPRSREGRFIRYALGSRLHASALHGAVRYLMAQRLSTVLPKEARCLQWFENQTYERCFNRGLRLSGARMPIYGTQLFIWAPEAMNYHVDPTEFEAHKPDILLVNGPYYRQDKSGIRCKVGPSLRYAKLFELDMASQRKNKALVLLPYYAEEARLAIELAIQLESAENLIFKFHPAVSDKYLKPLIPAKSLVSRENLYDIFSRIGLVIGAASGGLVEAAAIGIPVILVSRKNSSNYSYIPNIGKEVLWMSASNVEQAKRAKEILVMAFEHMPQERMAAIESLRSQLFTRPTKSAVLEALDL